MMQLQSPNPPQALFAVLLALLSTSCTRDAPMTADAAIDIALLGQALIEHDPRLHVEAPLASVLPFLDGQDIVMSNLEVAVCAANAQCEPTRTDQYFHGTDPSVLDYLDAIGVNLLSLANNHAWDYGATGVLSTIEEARRRGIVHAGTGPTLADATAPAYMDVAGQRVALVAIASAKLQPEAAATARRPGVNILLPDDTEAWQRNIDAIQRASAEAELTVVYQHFQSLGTPEWQQSWARAAIDSGADLYVSHGAPELSGVEHYGGGLILYGLGNFIFHSRSEVGHYPPEVWESVLVLLSFEAGQIGTVTFVPITIDEGTPGPDFLQERGYPALASGEDAARILKRLEALSAPFGTRIRIDGDRAYLDLAARASR